MEFGVPADGVTDAGPALEFYIAATPNVVEIGDTFPINASPPSGMLIDTTVFVPYQQFLNGEGRVTRFVVKDNPTDPTEPLFRLNLDPSDDWIEDYPGVYSTRVTNVYFNTDNARLNGYKMTAFMIGGSNYFEDIKLYGVQSLATQPTGGAEYLDQLAFKRIQFDEQPDNNTTTDRYGIDKRWTGDGFLMEQVEASVSVSDGVTNARRPITAYVGLTQGGRISEGVGGDHYIAKSDGFIVQTMHQEHGIITCSSSNMTIQNSVFYMRGDTFGDASNVPIQVTFEGTASINPGKLVARDNSFVYYGSFSTGYTITKDNLYINPTGRGDVQIQSQARVTRPNSGNEYGTGQRYGITVDSDDEDSFNRYSHFASDQSIYRCGLWDISADKGALPTTSTGLDAASSLNNIRLWDGASGTYYYKVQILYDVPRMIGLTGSAEITLSPVNGGNSPSLVITSDVRGAMMYRLYRGTSSGSYSSVVNVPILTSVRIQDTFDDASSFAWTSRTPGAVDAINADPPVAYSLNPGHRDGTSTAYGIVEYVSRGNATIPTTGQWRSGDIKRMRTPTDDGSRRLYGWYRLTTGSTHVLNTDWVEMWIPYAYANRTSTQFQSAADQVNTVGKSIGKTALDSTTGILLVSRGSTPTSVWSNCSTGATVWTPS